MSDLLKAYEIVKVAREEATDPWEREELMIAFDALDALTHEERMATNVAKIFEGLDDDGDMPECPNCALGKYACRVTGGSLQGAHMSTYACDSCAVDHVHRIGEVHPDVTVIKLSQKKGATA